MTHSREKYFERDRGPDLRRSEKRRVWQVNEMWDIHHEIARRLLIGQKDTSIAEDLNVSATMVGLVKKSPVVREKLDIMHAAADDKVIEMAKYIKDKAPVALRLLDDVIEGRSIGGITPPLKMRVDEANNWIDRAGFKAPQRVEGMLIHGHYTAQEIEDLKKEAASRTAAKVIDAEVMDAPAEQEEA